MAPSISVIIPTLNRADLLPAALQSLAEIADDDAEIIVIDNGSTDATAAEVRAVAARFPGLSWRHIHDAMPGLLTGRHRGAAAATGAILSFLDDDVVLSATWLRSIREAFANPDVALVGGPSWPRYEVDPPAWLGAFWRDNGPAGGRRCGALSLIDSGPVIKEIDPHDVWGLNFSIRRTVFDACGGFHPDCIPKRLQRYQGDGETGLASKLKAGGYKALHHPGAALWHVIPSARLTPQAMEQRGFYQGVCDSFTQIRRDGAPAPAGAPSPFERTKRDLRRAYLTQRGDGAAILRLMEAARMDGFRFHQREVANDPTLLAWVLRPDFLDYGLPDGWRAYATSALLPA